MVVDDVGSGVVVDDVGSGVVVDEVGSGVVVVDVGSGVVVDDVGSGVVVHVAPFVPEYPRLQRQAVALVCAKSACPEFDRQG